MEHALACGMNFIVSSKSSSRRSSSSKTSRAAKPDGCPTCGGTCASLATVRILSRSGPPTSGSRTGERASSLWPTATASDAKASGAAGYPIETRHSGVTLTDAAIRNWATPTRRDEKGPCPGKTKGGRELPSDVLFPTPSASTYGTSGNGCPGDGRETYQHAGTPSLETMARREGLALNPDWVCLLMGFPPGWI